ncbi:Schizosaccharomyces specific protein [Schizosaccharomyces pombe]|uniref:Uncharacterized protein C19G7.18c n=1 Tax=Schizosaccharomyces pombe (strain 972 / ATCC 24843) TaxID=284812 RepID=YGMI_SCHPO|nr:uncharacterized protein SPBC19G7.18c [Schizosaccharomyces pombe]Q7Z995.1 RecName: Full=Uncharacterized protein C19G7.18c [Schizosaccharomyces pombe 972h-]CAD99122.1 sequence orphan [Schizosaccharomyces pombe]|eukprot:NP_001018812.1 uncharacterized protein SPBC19G7.18c [Schizosaccharomyces pombe]
MDFFWERMLNDPQNHFSDDQKEFLNHAKYRVKRNTIFGMLVGFSLPLYLARNKKVTPIRLYATSIIGGLAGNGVAQITTLAYNLSAIRQRDDGFEILRKIQDSLIRQRTTMRQGRFPSSSSEFPPKNSKYQLPGSMPNTGASSSQDPFTNSQSTEKEDAMYSKDNGFEDRSKPASAWEAIRNRNRNTGNNSFPFYEEDSSVKSTDSAFSGQENSEAFPSRTSNLGSEQLDEPISHEQEAFDQLIWNDSSSSK